MRKTLAVATIAVLIGLLACAGPAPTPDIVGTRSPGEIGSHGWKRQQLRLPARSRLRHQTSSTRPRLQQRSSLFPMPRRRPLSRHRCRCRSERYWHPIRRTRWVTAVPTPVTNPATSVPTKAVATSTRAPIPTTTPASTREPALPTTTLTIAVATGPFRDIGIQQVPVEALGR